MRPSHVVTLTSAGCLVLAATSSHSPRSTSPHNNTVSQSLFASLEELARLVDISYCVGSTSLGIQPPFSCASRCSDFADIQLITTFNTGHLLSNSCGYLALAHPPANYPPRILLSFRGTYSIANAISDLSTIPQDYTPYPPPSLPHGTAQCTNCTVHTGFHNAWLATRDLILDTLTQTLAHHPTYSLDLLGHSLGGAIATLAALDLKAQGWSPRLTTFGAPRVGNAPFARFVEAQFGLLPPSPDTPTATEPHIYATDNPSQDADKWMLRRVTHLNDAVPLLPLESLGGYAPHAGELFIDTEGPLFRPGDPIAGPPSEDLPGRTAVRVCVGAEDESCSAGGDGGDHGNRRGMKKREETEGEEEAKGSFGLWPWDYISAHRDYIWRLGICLPGSAGGWASALSDEKPETVNQAFIADEL